MSDIIVVGGGPAGMTAALYARRNGKTVLVIERNGFGGQITHSPKIENYPGTQQIDGNTLADQMLTQILEQGAEIELETVTDIRVCDGYKVVSTEEGSHFEARAVILACGVKHRTLGLDGEDALIGDGISFCAVCDGDFYSDQVVCVAGGGNSALQEAVLLSEKCKEVILLQDLPIFTGEEKLQEILKNRPNVRMLTGVKILRYVTADNAFAGLEISQNGETDIIPCKGLFVAIGLIPENDAFASLADLDEFGYFASDETCLTRTPGIFVAGDCRRKSIRQIVTAAADGATAALAACRYLAQN